MKDVEFSAIKAGEADSLDPGRDPRESYVVRRNFTPKQVLTYIGVAVIMIGAIFGIGLIASVCGAFPSLSPPPLPHLLHEVKRCPCNCSCLTKVPSLQSARTRTETVFTPPRMSSPSSLRLASSSLLAPSRCPVFSTLRIWFPMLR